MKRKALTAVVLALVALALPTSAPASALSPGDFKNMSKYCKALRAEMGATAFRQAFNAGRNAHGKCVSRRGRFAEQPAPPGSPLTPPVLCPTEPPLPVHAFATEPCVVEPPLPVHAFGAQSVTAQAGASTGKGADKHAKKAK